MKISILLALTATAMLTLAACNKAESPAKVDSDVAKAAQSAAENDAKAREDQASTRESAHKELTAAEQKADSKTADADAEAAVTHAEGEHKVALERCEGLSGDFQAACKDKANAALEMAKANAKAAKAVHQ